MIKLDEIKIILNKHQPEVLNLTEANLPKLTDSELVKIGDYTLHTAPTMENDDLNLSCFAVCTKNNMIIKRRKYLEDKNISALWLEARLTHEKKLSFPTSIESGSICMGQADKTPLLIPAQLERWLVFSEKLHF